MGRPHLKEWRCFFCDEVFTNPTEAAEHFGTDQYEGFEHPGCIDPLRTDEKARLKELRDAQEYAKQLRVECDENDHAAGLLESYRTDIGRYFGECGFGLASTPHQAWLKHEAIQNELADARARISSLEGELLRIAGYLTVQL